MDIVEKQLSELRPYANNPRKNADAVPYVAESIRQFGFRVPLVISPDGEIVCGHTRYLAARQIGMTSVPCLVADDLTDEQLRAFRIADNKTAEMSRWDFGKLDEEIARISGIDMAAFGFDMSVFDNPDDVIEDEAPEAAGPEEEPVCQPGQIWQLGSHQLMCGDATDRDAIVALMDGHPADMLLTDPPYNVAYVGKTEDSLTIRNDSQDETEFFAMLLGAFQGAAAVTKCGGAAYIWHADTESVNFCNAFVQAGFYLSEKLIWNKNTLVMGRQDYHWKHEPCLYGWKQGGGHYFVDDRTQATVLEDRPNYKAMSKDKLIEIIEQLKEPTVPVTVIDEDKPARSADHPTMKPIKLMARLIRNSSRPGERVLDPFGGSGSTLVACEQLGRICHTMELDPHYCDVIIRRWETLTGREARLLA